MLRIVRKTAIIGSGLIVKKIIPPKLKEVSNSDPKLKECVCGLVVGIPYNGEMEVRYAA